MKNEKTLIITLIILFVVLCLTIPIKYELKDGGSITYKAIIWESTNYNTLPDTNGESLKGQLFKICGITVIDNTKKVKQN